MMRWAAREDLDRLRDLLSGPGMANNGSDGHMPMGCDDCMTVGLDWMTRISRRIRSRPRRSTPVLVPMTSWGRVMLRMGVIHGKRAWVFDQQKE